MLNLICKFLWFIFSRLLWQKISAEKNSLCIFSGAQYVVNNFQSDQTWKNIWKCTKNKIKMMKMISCKRSVIRWHLKSKKTNMFVNSVAGMYFSVKLPYNYLKSNSQFHVIYWQKLFFRDFPNHTTLQQHVKTHTHERPFECLECMLSFSTRSEMRIHEKMHNGEEQHICTGNYCL